MIDYFVGCRVKLPPFDDCPEEYGTLISIGESTGIVQLDDPLEPGDDGLREVVLPEEGDTDEEKVYSFEVITQQ